MFVRDLSAGTTRLVEVLGDDGQARRLEVKIPAGVRDGSLRLSRLDFLMPLASLALLAALSLIMKFSVLAPVTWMSSV